MIKQPLILFKKYFKQTAFFMLGVVVGISAFAAVGGGDKSPKHNNGNSSSLAITMPDFTPIKLTNNFSLRGDVTYKGSMIMSQQRNADVISINSVVTYQKGNTTYILPYKYEISDASAPVSTPAAPSSVNANSVNLNNLQLFNFKVRLHK